MWIFTNLITLDKKQNSWQKFAKKANKKGIHIAGSEGKSIFKTPDNPYGRGTFNYRIFNIGCYLLMFFFIVGVTGSGKPMTEQKTVRDKHVFLPTLDDQ